MLKLDEIYFPTHIKIFTFICNILSLINILLCIIILPIIFTKTLYSMKGYKRFFIAYIFVQIFFDLWSLFFKHTILLPLNVIINVGYLQDYANPILTNIGFCGFLTSIMIISDVLLCLFIERYYSITKTIIPHRTNIQLYLYLGILITNLALFITSILSYIVFEHLYSSEKAVEFLLSKISDPQNLISQQIPCIVDLFTSFSHSTLTTAFFFFIFTFSRVFGFCYFTYKNIKYIKLAETATNITVRRNHAIIIKTLIIQLFMMILLITTPALISFYIVTLQQPYPLLYLYIQCNYHFYPIFDLIVTISLIKPYRKAFLNFCFGTFSMIFGASIPVSVSFIKTSWHQNSK